jgi:hypothetical protein
MSPDIVRRDRVVGGQVLGALAGGDDGKAATARPIDQLADERRLVAIGERIDDAGGPRLLGQERPPNTSASTLTMTMCFFAAIAARAWAMPAAGTPVASTTTSIADSAQASAPDATKAVRAIRRSSQPTVWQAARARSGSRSAMTAISTPGMRGAWFRNIDPNLPAPISPTLTGRPAAARPRARL